MTNKAQSTLEYMLLLAAVVAVIILVTNGSNSLFQLRLTNTLGIATNAMQSMAGRLTNITP